MVGQRLCLCILLGTTLLTSAKPHSKDKDKSTKLILPHPEKVLSADGVSWMKGQDSKFKDQASKVSQTTEKKDKEPSDSSLLFDVLKDTDKDEKEEAIKDGGSDDLPAYEQDPCDNIYCRLGRVCQVDDYGMGQCVCAGDDYCLGHRKQACGTDGILYSSHCELHRMACVKGIHIRIDHTKKLCAGQEDPDKVLIRKERIDPRTEDHTEILSPVKKEQEGKNKASDGAENPKPQAEADNKKTDKKTPETDKEVTERIKKTDKGSIGKELEGQKQSSTGCDENQYKQFKDALVQYHCVRVGEVDCLKDDYRRQFVLKVMLNYYDTNGNRQVEANEMSEVEHQDRLEQLSLYCQLTSLLQFDDDNDDGMISFSEFYTAFDGSTAQIKDDLRVFHTLVTSGNSVELICDVQGASEIIWKRNGVALNDLQSEEVKVSEDGSLYISDLALHHIGNYTCQDRYNDRVVQTHVLKVQVPPTVTVNPHSRFEVAGNNVHLSCHGEGLPAPKLSWEFNEKPLPENPDDKHVMLLNANTTLEIRQSIYSHDTGAYKCKAINSAGTADDVAVVYIESDKKPHLTEQTQEEEVFVVFHDDGYVVYEPTHCHLKHQVERSYSHFKMAPFDLKPKTLCLPDKPCSWGAGVNVQDRYVYVSQPEYNRVVVVEVQDKYNPYEIILTDKVPVSMQYMERLDQVWVLCWNKLVDDGSKTVVVIRNASKPVQHHMLHTQPLADRFDMVQDLFLPNSDLLSRKFRHGYITHHQQMALYKLDLIKLSYSKVIDLSDKDCVPQSVSFLPIGGQILVHCHHPANSPSDTFQLTVDYITDTVVPSKDLKGAPKVSPDSQFLVEMDEDGDSVTVHKVKDDGSFEKSFEDYTSLHASGSAFFHSERGRSYDFYASSKTKNDLMYVNLASGKVEIIEGVGQAMPQKEWRWSNINRAVVSSSVFSEYLVTPSKDAIYVISGQHRHTQCEWQDITHGNVIVWIRVTQGVN